MLAQQTLTMLAGGRARGQAGELEAAKAATEKKKDDTPKAAYIAVPVWSSGLNVAPPCFCHACCACLLEVLVLQPLQP